MTKAKKAKEPKLFEVKEYESPPRVAKALGRSSDTVLAYITSGELEAFNLGSKSLPRWGISEPSLNAFLASRSSKKPTKKQRKPRKSPARIEELV